MTIVESPYKTGPARMSTLSEMREMYTSVASIAKGIYERAMILTPNELTIIPGERATQRIEERMLEFPINWLDETIYIQYVRTFVHLQKKANEKNLGWEKRLLIRPIKDPPSTASYFTESVGSRTRFRYERFRKNNTVRKPVHYLPQNVGGGLEKFVFDEILIKQNDKGIFQLGCQIVKEPTPEKPYTELACQNIFIEKDILAFERFLIAVRDSLFVYPNGKIDNKTLTIADYKPKAIVLYENPKIKV